MSLHEPPNDPAQWIVLEETQSFVVVPSVGSLLPGWLLVISKQHALSFGALPGAAAWRPELEEIAERWSAIFGPLTWFEHGPARPASPVGCGTDHAHMHLVPVQGLDLLSGARAMFPWLEFDEVGGLDAAAASVREELSYLLLGTADDRWWQAKGDRLPSQVFRRVIAHLHRRPNEWDWRRFPKTSVMQQTLERAGRDSACV